MRREMLLVSLLVVAMGADDGKKPATRIDEIVSAAEEREERLGRSFFVSWNIEESIKPGALNGGPMGAVGRNDPDAELNLTRTNYLAWDERNWRFDAAGKQLHRDQPNSAIQAVEQHFAHVHRAGVVNQLFASLDKDGASRGQIFTSSFEEDNAHLNDVANLPLTLFIRPSSIMLFRKIKEGEYEEIVGPADDRNDESEICLRDRRFKNHSFYFSTDADHICRRAQLGPRTTVEIAYAKLEGFGMAPKSWKCTQRFRDGTVCHVWKASAVKWHSRGEEIAPLIDFSFPVGTKVTDLRR